MKKLIILLAVFFLSCTPIQKPNKSVPIVKPSHKTKTVKKAQNQAPIKANESKEVDEEKEIIDKKLGYEVDENEDKERKEIEKILIEKNEYTWFDRFWNKFKVNRAEDLLKDLEKGKVYRTDESILLVIKTDDLTEKTLSELTKIYLLQKGDIAIYSNLDIKDKLIKKGLPQEKIKQRSRTDEDTIIRLNIEVIK